MKTKTILRILFLYSVLNWIALPFLDLQRLLEEQPAYLAIFGFLLMVSMTVLWVYSLTHWHRAKFKKKWYKISWLLALLLLMQQCGVIYYLFVCELGFAAEPVVAEVGAERRSESESALRYAGFWRRLAAFLIDAILLFVVVRYYFVLFHDFGNVADQHFANPQDLVAKSAYVSLRDNLSLALFLAYFLYSVILEGFLGHATFGKWVFRMRVVNSEGQKASLAKAFFRNLSKYLSCAVLFLGFIWAAFSPKKQAWHDYIAKTYVVRR